MLADMIRLPKSLAAWPDADFDAVLKQEIEQLDTRLLPLQQALSQSSHVKQDGFSVMLISCNEQADQLHIKTGVFFKGLIAGCNCADDPTPMDEYSEYATLLFAIDKTTADTQVSLLAE
ncbi:MAG: hypothetical protein PVG66_13810 [Chromatiales bacterium]|jgi:hypothetical protein